MHIKVKKQNLTDALSKIQGVIEKRSAIQILNHFLLSVNKGQAIIHATDNETAIKVPLEEVEIFSEGETCVPAKTFHEIVKELNDDIELKLVEKRLNIQSGNSKFRLAVLDAEDFPKWMEIDGIDIISFPRDSLLKAIKKTAYAIGGYDTRYILNGLMVEAKKGDIHFAATDGHRLAHVKMPFGISDRQQMIFPQKFVNEFKKLLDDSEEEYVEIRFGSNSNVVQFVLGELKFQTRLIQGNYPDYEAVIPRDNDKIAIIDKQSFLSSIKRVAIISKESNYVVVTTWQGNSLTIVAQDPELGEAKDIIEIDYKGEPITIGFNAEYMMDAVEGVSSEKIKITMSEPEKAIYITDTESNNFLYESVVMPVRL